MSVVPKEDEQIDPVILDSNGDDMFPGWRASLDAQLIKVLDDLQVPRKLWGFLVKTDVLAVEDMAAAFTNKDDMISSMIAEGEKGTVIDLPTVVDERKTTTKMWLAVLKCKELFEKYGSNCDQPEKNTSKSDTKSELNALAEVLAGGADKQYEVTNTTLNQLLRVWENNYSYPLARSSFFSLEGLKVRIYSNL